jgi:multicomponent Na+:H+ antiporter subunit E
MPTRNPKASRTGLSPILELFRKHRVTALKLAPILALFWLLLSGHYTPLLLTLGALSALLVVWVILRMEVGDEEGVPLRPLRRMPRYLVWLTRQILLSALTVLRLVWSPRRRPAPAVGVVPARELSDLSEVVYANSITLTPGTLSLSLSDEDIEVHALRGDDIGELRTGAMLDRVRRLESR